MIADSSFKERSMFQLNKLSDDRVQFLDVTSKGNRLLVTGTKHKRYGWRFRCNVDKLLDYEHLGKLMREVKGLKEWL